MIKLRDLISKQGPETIRIIGKILRSAKSYDGVCKLKKDDFLLSLREVSITLNKSENEVIFLLITYLKLESDALF
jgi:hypothetical protein